MEGSIKMSSVLIEQPNYVLRVSGREFSLITRALMGSLQEMAIKESDSNRAKKRKRGLASRNAAHYEEKEARIKEVELEDRRRVKKFLTDAEAAMKLGEKLLSQRCDNIENFHDYALRTIENSSDFIDLWEAASRKIRDDLKYEDVGHTPQVAVVQSDSESMEE
jgi:hypothetical protein